MFKTGAAALAAIAAMALAAPAQAGVLDHLQIKAGISGVLPNESSSISPIGGHASISDEYVPTVSFEYFVNDNVSVELLCCMARHDVEAVGTSAPTPGGNIDLGKVSHFPPTVTLKYRWTELGAFQPYVGAGVNYTHFFDAKLPAGGPVTSIKYDDSWGGALQAGFDYRLNDHWALNLDVRRIWINTDVNLNSVLGPVHASVDVDPYVVTTGIGYRF